MRKPLGVAIRRWRGQYVPNIEPCYRAPVAIEFVSAHCLMRGHEDVLREGGGDGNSPTLVLELERLSDH